MKTVENVKIYRDKYEALPERFVQKIESDLSCILKRKIPGLKKVYLFGSCARGEVRSTSDIDLLIITEGKMQDRTLAADIRWSLDVPRDGVRTDVVYRSEETCGGSAVFDRELERDKKLILEVEG